MNRKKALIYLAAAAALWSIAGLFIKLIDWNPLAIAGARSAIAALVMVIYLKKPKIKMNKTNIFGALSYTSLLILFVASNRLTTSANAILLQFTSPIWVVIWSKIFLKETPEKSDWIVIAAVILGMTMFFAGELKGSHILGNFTAILSGIAMAALVIFLKLQKEGSPVEITLLGNIFTLAAGIPFFFLSAPSMKSILYILILGIFQLGISYILYATAVKYVSSIEAILIPIVEPLLNPIWVMLFTGETPGIYALFGGIIIITSIVLWQKSKITKGAT
jgi:drug/metabolite transporter (DMT)-like permease